MCNRMERFRVFYLAMISGLVFMTFLGCDSSPGSNPRDGVSRDSDKRSDRDSSSDIEQSTATTNPNDDVKQSDILGGDTAPETEVTATLKVTVTTSGENVDENGYTVSVDKSRTRQIASNGSVTFNELRADDHTVALADLRDNCRVHGDNPQGISIAAGSFRSVSFEVRCGPDKLRSVKIPTQSQFEDHGAVLTGGDCGRWDWWMGAPLAVMRQGDTYYLYYQGQDGSRPDSECDDGGQQRNRFIGLATANKNNRTDADDWSKSSANPIVKHQPAGGRAAGLSGEGGVIGGGSPGIIDGTFILYFGGMEEFSYESVDSDVVYLESQNGIDWANQSDAGKAGTIAGNDETFPFGAVKIGDTYSVYYTAKGGDVTNNTVYLLSGSDPADFGSNSQKVSGPDEGKLAPSSGDIIRISPDRVLVTVWDFFTARDAPIEVRSAPTSDLSDLTTLETEWDWPEVRNSKLYLDRQNERWLLFYSKWSSDVTDPLNPDSSTDEIWLKTAPVQYR